jgi:hypothetical protein
MVLGLIGFEMVQPFLGLHVEGFPQAKFGTLVEARCEAGRLQRIGERRSLRIYCGDKVVDLKRF